MYLLGKIKVTADIPKKLEVLKDIAYNLWWSWNSDAIDLYREIDLEVWEKLNKNPVRFLQEVSQKKLLEKMDEKAFMQKYKTVVEKYNNYMNDEKTWYKSNHADKKHHTIAYFSAEYGLNEVLPVYSGGLGVLSGDHCKSASDLDLPFVGVGLFYRQGYFSQRINKEGWQETVFSDLNTSQLPLRPALDADGNQVQISVELPGRVVFANVWRVQVGRISIYLMDTDVEKNSEHDRYLTARLYGGDQETRIQQEIFLGIGGIRVLDALGINATVYHMNEGHSAFLGLELIRKLVQNKGLKFKEAREVVASSGVFTTHTPVPAGNDVFPIEMIDKYFGNYISSLGINRHEFLDLGLKVVDHQNFNMTVLALSLSGKRNGVSELHGAVSRNIYNNIWPNLPEEEVPIGHITNGIHTLTWLSPSFRDLYDKHLGKDWYKHIHKKELWDKVDDIPDKEIWDIHCELKNKMIHWVRLKLKEQRMANGESIDRVKEAESALDPNALTLGFARRFATYKRANLIFRNVERIKKILNAEDMPVQIVFAGKAHPADRPAHEVIKNINDIASQEGFTGKVVLVENYNMTLARNMVQGVDIWLNNPRRPLEASGTSGQKVTINGILNFSILDGWWCEGYNGKNGWAIGKEVTYDNDYYQDNSDSESIYNILENDTVPLYFNRNSEGVPENWIKKVKESIKTLAYKFSSERMVHDYCKKMYIPSMLRTDEIVQSDYNYVKDLANWRENMERDWSQVKILSKDENNLPQTLKSVAGNELSVNTSVHLGSISPDNVSVQLYYGIIGENNKLENPKFEEMQLTKNANKSTFEYSSKVTIFDGGEYGYTFRVVPKHSSLLNPYETGLIRWVI